jgi:chromosomal replication initiator protein
MHVSGRTGMDIQEVWDKLIQTIKSYPGVNPSQIDAFFSRIQIQAVSPGFIMLTAGTAFIKEWVERHYVKDIKRALEDLYGVDFLVQIEVDTTAEEEENSESPSPIQDDTSSRVTSPSLPENISAAPITQQRNKVNEQVIQQEDVLTTPSIAPSSEETNTLTESSSGETTTSLLTFDSFVIGDSNRLAYAMATEVAERPGTSNLNPLFIYGRSGVGKTHLMCAIKNYICEQYSDLNVIYIDSMELVNRYSDAAREKTVDKSSFKNFESFFKEADVLLIDDIQSLQGKAGTLDTLFRIFNAGISQGKQFVFSADRAPKNIDLEERYTSRFNSGATIDIQPPDDETKRSIIKNFIQQYQQDEDFNFDLSDDILDYIVEHSGSNIRELKSAITNVIFAIKMNRDNSLTTQDVKDMLANHFINESGTRFTIETIQAAVEDFYHVSHSDLVSKKRSRPIAHPRQVAIYLARELINTTYAEIGKAFNRDHSTIMHSFDLIEKGLNEDRNLREEIEAIREKLRTQQY